MTSPPIRKQTVSCPYDFTGARRVRHAFRLIVLLVFLFTVAVWFSEGYLRYGSSETQYRMSLTLYPDQARPILSAVVRREIEKNELAPSLYLEALAQVEKPDKVLENYELAYNADTRNAALTINYGCALYQNGQYEEARERFREAGVNPPRNVLPRYLEAAALAAGMDAEGDLSDVIALLTRANASGDPVLFPDPLWHESLPKNGQRYLECRRAIAQRVVTPLNECTTVICERAHESILKGELHNWDNWLEVTALMGTRLMGAVQGDSPAAMPQLVAALQIQQAAAKVRVSIAELYGGGTVSDLNDALLHSDDRLKKLRDFDGAYNSLLTAQYERFGLPFLLLFETVLAFFLVYIVGWFFHFLGTGGKSARAVPHIWIAKATQTLALACMLIILLALMIAHNTAQQADWEYYVPIVWRWILGVVLGIGLIYPPLLARKAQLYERAREEANRDVEGGTAPPKKRRFALRQYLGVYGCLLRRYMAILSGGLIIMVCIWLLIYRIEFGIYPFQMELITSSIGMLIEALRQYVVVS